MHSLQDRARRAVAPAAPEAARPGVRAASVTWPLIVGTLMMLLGVVMRAPIAAYDGPPEQAPFNLYIFRYLGAYSDIASLYFRDRLWERPVPYVGYDVEYPVGMGVLIWVLNVARGLETYFLLSAAFLIACGVAVFWLGRSFAGANLWLLALAPALPLYIVINWDMFAILLTLAALVLFRRDRDVWGALALAAAVWTKFFPIVMLPLVLLDRALRRRWHDAARIAGVFAVASVAINAPFALQIADDGVRLRDTWLTFFRFNEARTLESWSANLWNLPDPFGVELPISLINTASAALVALGTGAAGLLLWWAWRHGLRPAPDLLLPASAVAITWFFFVNKIYSSQYSLWIVVFLALLAAPRALVVAFDAADLIYFVARFVLLYLSDSQNPITDWFYLQMVWPATMLREAVTLAIILWIAHRALRPAAAPDPA